MVNDTGTTLFINGKPINCLTQEELEMRQTDIFTLCRRIKEAYEEGAADRQWNCNTQTDQQLWNTSKAKRIYDILIKQAMEQ